jgi:hypothetical protein
MEDALLLLAIATGCLIGFGLGYRRPELFGPYRLVPVLLMWITTVILIVALARFVCDHDWSTAIAYGLIGSCPAIAGPIGVTVAERRRHVRPLR